MNFFTYYNHRKITKMLDDLYMEVLKNESKIL